MSFTASLAEIIEKNANGLLGSRPTWRRVRLGEFCSILNGAPFPSERFSSIRGTPLIRIRDLVRGKTETFLDDTFDPAYMVHRSDLLVGMDGDFNCTLWAGEPGLLNQRVCKITPDERRADRRFLTYVVPGYLSAINANTSAITVKHLSSRTLADLPLPLPSIDEQLRLVGYLDEQLSRLDASVAALHRVQANLKRYRASVLKGSCEGRLVPTEAELARQEGRDFETGAQLLQRVLATRATKWTARGDSAIATAPDAKRLPALPEGWTWANAAQICGFITKGTTPSADKLTTAGDVQFLKVYNLTDDGVLNHAYKPAFISRETHEGELARSMTMPGDVLMNIVGPPLGQVSVVPPGLTQANINQAIARFRTVLPEMNRYLAQVLLTKDVLDRSLREAKTTVGQVNLTLQICREIAIPLPPLAEQHRIVAEADRRLSLIRAAEAQVTTNLARAQRLRQSILRAAFSVPA